MARPNNGKSNNQKTAKISKSLFNLLMARKLVLSNDGQRFAKSASLRDISDEFVEHYWKMSTFSAGGSKMRRAFTEVTKSNRNI